MILKMKDLIALTNETKSTILYYIKEGLLPTPKKPKPNVHLYHENSVQIIKFIKYLQHNYSYSISDIKSIFTDNCFDFDGSFDSMIKSLELISIGKSSKWYSKDEFLQVSNISSTRLEYYINNGYLMDRELGFSSKEVDIVSILENTKKLGLPFNIVDEYVKTAQTLSIKENTLHSALIDDSPDILQYELIFDIILKLKPYIFNLHTIKTYKHNKDK